MKKELAEMVVNVCGDNLSEMSEDEIEGIIVGMADDNDGFENLVFELGVSRIAKYIMQHRNEYIGGFDEEE